MRISRSKVDLFIECPRCFWLNQKAKIKRPAGLPFNLNVAVDHLLKNEFDAYRGKGIPPRLEKEGLQYIPASQENLSIWRNNFKGVVRLFGSLEINFFGAIDDLWIDNQGCYYVADYKATSKAEEVNLNADWQISYKRQVEFYQWLLRGNGLHVSNRAWFVYANGIKDDRAFGDTLHFKTKLIFYDGDDSWIEPVLERLTRCLELNAPPDASEACEFCRFVSKRLSSYGG